jgi:hypothetical protein
MDTMQRFFASLIVVGSVGFVVSLGWLIWLG